MGNLISFRSSSKDMKDVGDEKKKLEEEKQDVDKKKDDEKPKDDNRQSKTANGTSVQNVSEKNKPKPLRYRNSMKGYKRPASLPRMLDTRQIKTSRGSVRPKVTSGTLWEDPVFPREMAMEGSRMEGMNYRWMRPKEFCKSPSLVNGKPSRYDVMQGSIGNCWMIATLAGIADHLMSILRIIVSTDYDPKSSGYDGVFHCRFWYQGQWVDIYVDDCLPVKTDNSAPMRYSLIGACSPDPNILWVALVEKALAKFHGSYQSIEAREREYGWRLLTGGVPTVLEKEALDRTPTEKLFQRIKTALENGEVVTCSHPIERGRLHAYTVTGARHHTRKGNVIRIRNPWGEQKSKISYLQTPEEWPYEEPDRREDFECKDGEFWVMKGECYREFTQFCIGCFKADFHIAEDNISHILDHKYSFFGEWKGETAAGVDKMDIFKNTKYQIRISGSKRKQKKLLLELLPRPVNGQNGICVYMYKITKLKTYESVLCQEVEGDTNSQIFVANGCPQYQFTLSPGTYMAIPLTRNKGDEREFCLRVFSHSHIECKELSGIFFHQQKDELLNSEEIISTKTDTVCHYPGLWHDLYINDESLSSQLPKIPQYQLKVSEKSPVTVSLTQQFTTKGEMVIRLYKVPENTTLPLEQDFIDQDHATPEPCPLRIPNPAGNKQYTLNPESTYVLIVFPWTATRPRHFVVSLRAPVSAKLQSKPLNLPK